MKVARYTANKRESKKLHMTGIGAHHAAALPLYRQPNAAMLALELQTCHAMRLDE